MPSTHATSGNISHPSFTSGPVTCEVTFNTNTDVTTLDTAANALSDSDPHFVRVVCDLGGKLNFQSVGMTTGQGTITFSHDADINDIFSSIVTGSNMRKKDGMELTTPHSLHMEVLRDMYESGTTRPSETAITASFTDTSIETFRDTLYQAINDSVSTYVKSRFRLNGTSTGTPIQPMLCAFADATGPIDYGDTHDRNATFGVDDGQQHGRMFLLNVLRACSVGNIRTLVRDNGDPTKYLNDTAVMGTNDHMLFGLKVTTTGGFHNTHTKYAVGVTFA